MTINITKWGTKKKVAENTPQIPEIPYVHSGIFLATLNTTWRRSKGYAKKNTIHCQGCYFWGNAQVMGYGILKKKVQGKDTMNEKQRIPCRYWCHGTLFFLHKFLRFVLLLMLENSGKLTIIHDNLFPLFQTLHLFRCSANASWESMGDLIYHFFGTDLLRSIFDQNFRKVVLLMLQKCSYYCVVLGDMLKPFIDIWPYMVVFSVWVDILGCVIDLIDG